MSIFAIVELLVSEKNLIYLPIASSPRHSYIHEVFHWPFCLFLDAAQPCIFIAVALD